MVVPPPLHARQRQPPLSSKLFSTLLLICGLLSVEQTAAQEIDFEKQIAPLLSQHCVRCHYDGNSKGDVSFSHATDLSDYLDLKNPGESYLIELVQANDGAAPEMPKDGAALSEDEVALLKEWISQGAVWPDDVLVREMTKADASWWAFQPIQKEFEQSSIDDFIRERLEAEGLKHNKPASRRDLVRRATYDLTGLPPTPEEIRDFVEDDDPRSYERLLDRLLHSKHYGERWGRHWLDVVRFGESNGFERNVIINELWPFRDYVIRSINQDKPFDQFIREHIAGDVFGGGDPDIAVGTAFLVAGPYDDVGNQDAVQARQIRANTIDEMIRATTEAFMGLTIGCARCHDHKFDPILQSDYYSLYSTFAGVKHGATRLGTQQQKTERDRLLKPLNARKREIESSIETLRGEIKARAEHYAKNYRQLWSRPAVNRAGTEEKFPAVEAKFVRLVCEARDTSIKAKAGFGIDEFEVWARTSGSQAPINVALASNGGKASGASRKIEDFPGAYAASLTIDGETGGARFLAATDTLTIELAEPTWIDRVFFSSARNAKDVGQGGFFSFVAEYRIEISLDGKTWQEVANGRDRKPTGFASNPTHEEHRLFNLEIVAQEQQRLKRLGGELNRLKRDIAKVPELDRVWIGSRDAPGVEGPFHLFLGGSPERHGAQVQTVSLDVLNGLANFELDSHASEATRRLALANWLVDDQNPLTARVLANRVWHYHFGKGLVATPSDFGYMGGAPSHPELLDFLATKLGEFDWRLKPLHRLIMSSKVYQQSSKHNAEAAAVDHDSRLLWRFPPRRLSAEEIRDTILLAAGEIQKYEGESLVPDGGPGFRLYRFMQDNVCTYSPLDAHGKETYRRAVYHQNARASVVDLMTDFDQPDCAFSTPRRAETTTPLQSLTMMNHKFTMDMAASLAKRLESEKQTTAEQIERAFEICFGRSVQPNEQEDCLEFVTQQDLKALCRVLLNTSEMIYVR